MPPTSFDIAVINWHGAGLLAKSNVRLHKLATLEKTDIHRKLGRLQMADRQEIAAALRRIAELW
jgi:mRNA interferase MazF